MPKDTLQYDYLKIGALAFGMTPFLGLILNVMEYVLIARIISQLGVLVLVYGIYSYASVSTGSLKEEGNKIAVLFLVFWMFNIAGVIIDSFFPLEIPENTQAEEQQVLASLSVLAGMLAVVFYAVFLYAAVKFTKWFEQVATRVSIGSTSAVRWLGIVYIIAAASIFTGKTLLYSLILLGTGQETNYAMTIAFGGLALIGIGSLLLLAGLSLQVVAGLLLFLRLNDTKGKQLYPYKAFREE